MRSEAERGRGTARRVVEGAAAAASIKISRYPSWSGYRPAAAPSTAFGGPPPPSSTGEDARCKIVALLAALCLATPALADDNVLATFQYKGGSSLKVAYGDLHFVVDSTGASAESQVPRLRAFVDGKPVFVIKLETPAGANEGATIKVVRLEGPEPQVVFQHFTGGAHCCVETRIATKREAGWTIVDAGSLDGDRGYVFEDVGGTGTSALLSTDGSFLYRFTNYAESVAPIRIQALEGDRLANVTRDPRYRPALVQSLANLEKDAPDNDYWRSNGFLAAWVATKIMLGQGAPAWSRMLKDYERDSDWEMQVCADPVPEASCRKDRLHPADFPEALRAHLRDTGYIADVKAFPLPPDKGAAR